MAYYVLSMHSLGGLSEWTSNSNIISENVQALAKIWNVISIFDHNTGIEILRVYRLNSEFTRAQSPCLRQLQYFIRKIPEG